MDLKNQDTITYFMKREIKYVKQVIKNHEKNEIKPDINEFDGFFKLINYMNINYEANRINKKQLKESINLIKEYLNLFKDKTIKDKNEEIKINYFLNL